MGMEDALARARNERAPVAAASIGSRATSFARYEAAKQSPESGTRLKTWVADTERHAKYDGETVPLTEAFSGGFEPGSEANCRCAVSIT